MTDHTCANGDCNLCRLTAECGALKAKNAQHVAAVNSLLELGKWWDEKAGLLEKERDALASRCRDYESNLAGIERARNVAEIECGRLVAEVARLQHNLAQKQGEIGRAEHRGNTVDYIYDKCAAYGKKFDEMRDRVDYLDAQLTLARDAASPAAMDSRLARLRDENAAGALENARLREALERIEVMCKSLGAPDAEKCGETVWCIASKCCAALRPVPPPPTLCTICGVSYYGQHLCNQVGIAEGAAGITCVTSGAPVRARAPQAVAEEAPNVAYL
jgi:hypothetical protein